MILSARHLANETKKNVSLVEQIKDIYYFNNMKYWADCTSVNGTPKLNVSMAMMVLLAA